MGEHQNGLNDGDKVRSSIRMLIPQDKQNEALEILGRVRDQVQFEPHCISTRLYRSVDEDQAIMLEELWNSSRGMVEHLKSDAYRQVLLVVEMADEPPDIHFDTITDSGGVEVIEHARNQS